MNRIVWGIIALLVASSLSAQQAALRVAPASLRADAVEARDVEISQFGSYVAIYDLSEFNTVRLFSEDLEELWKHQLSHYWAGSLNAGSVLAFSPDESELYFPGYRTDEDICVCSAETGEPLQVLLGHENDVTNLDASPNGRLLLTASSSEIVLWGRGANGFEELDRLDEYEPVVQSIAFLPDGERFVVTSRQDRQRTVTLFSAAGNQITDTSEYALETNNLGVEFEHTAATPDGAWIASGYRNDLYFFRVEEGTFRSVQQVEEIELGNPSTIVASPDGRYFVSGHFGFLRWWRLDGGQWQPVLTTATQQPSSADLAFHPAGEAIYLGSTGEQNALASFSVEGVDPSPAGMIARALNGELSDEQRSVLDTPSARDVVDTIGETLFSARDMFETADEYEARRAVLRYRVQDELVDRILRRFQLQRREVAGAVEIEIPLENQGSYSVDELRYEIDILASRGSLQIDRDAARSLFQNWNRAVVLASRSRESEELVADFRVRHPQTGAEYQLILDRNPFTGAEMNTARTVIPAIRVGPDLVLRELELQALFPALRYSYAKQPFGEFILENAGSGIVSNVEIEVALDGISTPREVVVPASLAAGRQVPGSLVVPIGQELESYAQGGSVGLTLEISYSRSGRQHRSVFNRQVRVVNRNAIQWDDDRKVAAFVSATDPRVVEIAARVTAGTRQVATPVITRNMHSAIELFAALDEYGISYVIDPNSAYQELSLDSAAIDYVRFPVETLSDGVGDCDDLSVLFASLLESVGVSTAFITTPGHIFMAFDSGIAPADAPSLFESRDSYLVLENTVWLPVETTALADGFVRAWQLGALQWREAERERSAGFFTTRSAWAAFEPVPQPQIDPASPGVAAIHDRAATELTRFREIELEPKLNDVDGASTDPAIANRQGVLFATYGLLDEASDAFSRALGAQEYVPALINLANVASVKNNDSDAERFLERAAAAEPQNARVLMGLALLYWERGDRERARTTYEQASRLSPALARRFPLFAAAESDGTRASGQSELFSMDWAEE